MPDFLCGKNHDATEKIRKCKGAEEVSFCENQKKSDSVHFTVFDCHKDVVGIFHNDRLLLKRSA